MTAPLDLLAPEVRDRVAYADDSIVLLSGRWQDYFAGLPVVDAVITDPPYSDRTHGAYREMPELGRAAIGYESWTAGDVEHFVDTVSPLASGWFCALTDHALARHWESSFDLNGRYVFSPLACIEPGSRVRLCGDGPAQWAVWLIVARPKTRAAQQWGALPGGYVVGAHDGWRGTTGGRGGVTGSKPLALMRAIVRDYSRPGDLVLDPFCGSGTTALACRLEGRRCITIECDPNTVEIARRRMELLPTETAKGQRALFGDAV